MPLRCPSKLLKHLWLLMFITLGLLSCSTTTIKDFPTSTKETEEKQTEIQPDDIPAKDQAQQPIPDQTPLSRAPEPKIPSSPQQESIDPTPESAEPDKQNDTTPTITEDTAAASDPIPTEETPEKQPPIGKRKTEEQLVGIGELPKDQEERPRTIKSALGLGFAVWFLLLLLWGFYRLKDLPEKYEKYKELDGTNEYRKGHISRRMKNRVDRVVWLTFVILPFELIDSALNVFDAFPGSQLVNGAVQVGQIIISSYILYLVGQTLLEQFSRWWGNRREEGVVGRLKGIWHLITNRYYKDYMKHMVGYYERGKTSLYQVTIIPLTAIVSSIYGLMPNAFASLFGPTFLRPLGL